LVSIGWLGLGAAIIYTNLVIGHWVTSNELVLFVTPAGTIWALFFSSAGLFRKLATLRQQREAAHARQIEVQGLTRLVQVVCHDICNPLNVISGSLLLMERTLKSGATPGSLASLMQRAKVAERTITAIIDDVRALELLRLSNDGLPVAPFDLNGAAREATLPAP
jgi:signal transduction histidine kinase